MYIVHVLHPDRTWNVKAAPTEAEPNGHEVGGISMRFGEITVYSPHGRVVWRHAPKNPDGAFLDEVPADQIGHWLKWCVWRLHVNELASGVEPPEVEWEFASHPAEKSPT